ncbi:hypothetical protein Cadr_000021019 [Camelus dromedarius]|uniref:Uncharacterized protein n=1 Tax=Camelus dromedarius TaxID=9838 RepID=A0A5N4CUB6_CAMDR|nr:hypothetical protein Cadr_000021019 [Camelus dromedarius]
MQTAGVELAASQALAKPHPCRGKRPAAAAASASAASSRPPSAAGSDGLAAPCCAAQPSGRSGTPATHVLGENGDVEIIWGQETKGDKSAGSNTARQHSSNSEEHSLKTNQRRRPKGKPCEAKAEHVTGYLLALQPLLKLHSKLLGGVCPGSHDVGPRIKASWHWRPLCWVRKKSLTGAAFTFIISTSGTEQQVCGQHPRQASP